MPMKIKRWNGFSVTNATQKEAKLTYIKLNRQTPCPPRSAVPVNQAVCGRLFHSQPAVRFRSWRRIPAMSAQNVAPPAPFAMLELIDRADILGSCLSGKGTALLPLPPLRTGHESFPSSGSSRCKAPRERSRFHDGLIPASWRWMPNFLQNARKGVLTLYRKRGLA
jgi:hypothetical protein